MSSRPGDAERTPQRAPTAKRPTPPAALTLALALALAGVVAGAAGCAKGTYLVVSFTRPSATPDVYGIRVALGLTSAGSAARRSAEVVSLGKTPTVIPFPTSVAFRLDDVTGSITIDADALDKTGNDVAKGTATTTIQHAQTWTVPVALASAAALTVSSPASPAVAADALPSPPDAPVGSSPSPSVAISNPEIEVDWGLDTRAREPSWTIAPPP